MKHGITFALFVQSLVLTAAAHAQGHPGNRQMWGHMWDDWGWEHMMFGSIMMMLFWGGIITVVVLVVRRLSSGPTDTATLTADKTPLDILRERFARGEIDKEEFDERKRVLSS